MTNVLLIAVSGYSQEKDRAQARQAGFDHHLSKPIELDTVLTIIKRPGGRDARSTAT